MAMIAYVNLEAMQYNAMTAFLFAKIKDHKIYVEQPKGYEENNDSICSLLKALYVTG